MKGFVLALVLFYAFSRPPECDFCVTLKVGTLDFKEEEYLDLGSSPNELALFDQ